MAEGDQLMEQLQSFLGSEEGMKQLQSAAQMLGLGQQGAPPSAMQGGAAQSAAPPPVPSVPAAPASGMDLGALLSSLGMGGAGGASGQAPPPPAQEGMLGGMDPQAMLKIAKVMQAANKESPSSNLLRALKPLLREERQGKVDDAIRMMQLFSLLPLLKEGFG